MKEENFDVSGIPIIHNGTIQIWKDKNKYKFYRCFFEKNRIGEHLFTLNKEQIASIVRICGNWLCLELEKKEASEQK